MAEFNEPAITVKRRTNKLVILVIVLLIMIPVGWAGFSILSWCRVSAHTMWCEEHFHNFRCAFYCCKDNDGHYLPLPEKWCDNLIAECDISLEGFDCIESDTVAGESAYAMNSNAVGKKLNELPPDMVLIFESDKGKGQARSQIFTERAFAGSFKKNQLEKYKYIRVYPQRWNQLGGPDDAAFRHPVSKEKCCHVLFVDGSVALASKEGISILRWNDKTGPNMTHCISE